mgnify:CR=1 FL=1
MIAPNTTEREGCCFEVRLLDLRISLPDWRPTNALHNIFAALVWRPVLALEHLNHFDFLIRQRVSTDGLRTNTNNP